MEARRLTRLQCSCFVLIMMADPEKIAAALHDAPAWALIGLTAPRGTLREDAARAVADHLCNVLTRPESAPEGQMSLPI
ncbi:DUF6771 family protein [Sphingomonas sp. SORGH_AS_0870]|uniref:DUF6771 family protein n=1 Tax=Sphingomonas sp. SORGH_AS_0870 TaxID=3041801 RepID=UPI00386FA0C9